MELTPHQERKRKQGICIEKGCTKNRANHHSICAMHIHRRRKLKDPASYTYHSLKCNAKRRNKVFTITIEYFRQWCEETGYLLNKGRTACDASIDRIDPSKGYEPGNLKMITVSENIRKRYTDYYRSQEVPDDYAPPDPYVKEVGLELGQQNTTIEQEPW